MTNNEHPPQFHDLPSTTCYRGRRHVPRQCPAMRRFEIRDDRPFLGGQAIDLWGLHAAMPCIPTMSLNDMSATWTT